MQKYYERYEQRYQTVAQAGIDTWGYTGEEKKLQDALAAWVEKHGLKGKRIIEFACGEGGCGVILCELGCEYLGVDISPTAVEKAKERLKGFKNAQVMRMDMTKSSPAGLFDSALDVMGFHMLVTDEDRKNYLQTACRALKEGAPMLFFNESFREEEINAPVHSVEDWARLTGMDFDTPQKREWRGKEVYLPTLPARPRNKAGYQKELEENGFIFESLEITSHYEGQPTGAAICAHKR
ncbi:MAG: class I SAM-dependent methyltransferase [Clostridiales bacterium]|nr:class I SAM-dependent methyltransferase [Clostridiales bacterium]